MRNGGKKWKGRKLKQEKSMQICEICVDIFHSQGVSVTTEQVASA